MCCLFGVIDYKQNLSSKQLNRMIAILSKACEARGTDATGISYNTDEKICIYKRPLPAHKMHYKIPDGVHTVMGHTRMTTQGNERFNYNNHPFFGKTDNANFALAHNGVLYNDILLREKEKLPETKIETDSYVAVQLIEKMKHLDFESLSYMAEHLSGSFTITVMDNENNLYFVKGDNPMCIYHFPEVGIYIYASTEEILKKALHKMPYRFGRYKKVELEMGEILKFDCNGKMEKATFDTDLLCACSFYSCFRPHRTYISSKEKPNSSEKGEYIEILKSHAAFYGYTEDMVDMLLDDGYSTDDIEELLFCGAW